MEQNITQLAPFVLKDFNKDRVNSKTMCKEDIPLLASTVLNKLYDNKPIGVNLEEDSKKKILTILSDCKQDPNAMGTITPFENLVLVMMKIFRHIHAKLIGKELAAEIINHADVHDRKSLLLAQPSYCVAAGMEKGFEYSDYSSILVATDKKEIIKYFSFRDIHGRANISQHQASLLTIMTAPEAFSGVLLRMMTSETLRSIIQRYPDHGDSIRQALKDVNSEEFYDSAIRVLEEGAKTVVERALVSVEAAKRMVASGSLYETNDVISVLKINPEWVHHVDIYQRIDIVDIIQELPHILSKLDREQLNPDDVLYIAEHVPGAIEVLGEEWVTTKIRTWLAKDFPKVASLLINTPSQDNLF